MYIRFWGKLIKIKYIESNTCRNNCLEIMSKRELYSVFQTDAFVCWIIPGH